MKALEVQGLTRTFGRQIAVDNLSVSVEAGDIYGFLGPNGAGKTTAMRCMLGLLSCDKGDVRFFGNSNLDQARAQIGAIIEVPCFDDWMSGETNLELSCAYLGLTGQRAKAEVGRVLERVGLAERAKDKAGTYSLGMRQRLGIARALLGKPKLLMLDEPTNGLDPRGMREVREFIQAIAEEEGTTIFLSSHLLSEIQALCNRVGIIENGQMRAEGTVAEFLDSQGEGWVEIESPQPDKVKALIKTLDWAQVEEGGTSRIRARVTDGTIARLNKALVNADIDVEALIPTKASLEDVFLQVTT